MTALEPVRQLWDHAFWADAQLLAALRSADGASADALGEYAHIVGAEAVWLDRLEGRPQGTAVWPAGTLAEIEDLAARTHAGYRRYLERLSDADLGRSVDYTNSAGRAFTSTIGDILLHVALHGQYHRGKVNLLLRQASRDAAPVDFIAFVRGAPAARRNG